MSFVVSYNSSQVDRSPLLDNCVATQFDAFHMSMPIRIISVDVF